MVNILLMIPLTFLSIEKFCWLLQISQTCGSKGTIFSTLYAALLLFATRFAARTECFPMSFIMTCFFQNNVKCST